MYLRTIFFSNIFYLKTNRCIIYGTAVGSIFCCIMIWLRISLNLLLSLFPIERNVWWWLGDVRKPRSNKYKKRRIKNPWPYCMNKHFWGSNERPNWVDFLIQTIFYWLIVMMLEVFYLCNRFFFFAFHCTEINDNLISESEFLSE